MLLKLFEVLFLSIFFLLCRTDQPRCKTGSDLVLLQHGKGAVARSWRKDVPFTVDVDLPHIENPNLREMVMAGPDTIFFDAVIRDFREDHPDFQSFDGHHVGLVLPVLGADKRPVWNPRNDNKSQIPPVPLSNQTYFDQWFRDTAGINKRLNFRMDFVKTESGTYVHDDKSFFPIDGKGWNDTQTGLDNASHNFFFTLEMSTSFIYIPGQTFTFRGDDDVWVFMNDQLVIDLGGVHNPMEKSFNVDELNLTEGAAVDLRFFFAERRCCGSEFRMETSIVPVTGTCTIWGDPHIDPFDNGIFGQEKRAALSIYSSGDYWLVKNEEIQIQGRYGTTIFTPSNMSALLALAFSGPWLRNETLIVESEEGKISYAGQEILSELPSQFKNGICNLKYTSGKKHIDGVLKNYPVKMIQAFFTRNVRVTINRWPKHIDAIIQMPQQLGGQDGHCGNFNFNISDDSLEASSRVPLPPSESLFPKEPKEEEWAPTAEAKEVTLEDCAMEVRQKATVICEQMREEEAFDAKAGKTRAEAKEEKTRAAAANSFHKEEDKRRQSSASDVTRQSYKEAKEAASSKEASSRAMVLDACVFDYCFGGKDFAAEGVIVEHEAEVEEASESGEAVTASGW